MTLRSNLSWNIWWAHQPPPRTGTTTTDQRKELTRRTHSPSESPWISSWRFPRSPSKWQNHDLENIRRTISILRSSFLETVCLFSDSQRIFPDLEFLATIKTWRSVIAVKYASSGWVILLLVELYCLITTIKTGLGVILHAKTEQQNLSKLLIFSAQTVIFVRPGHSSLNTFQTWEPCVLWRPAHVKVNTFHHNTAD